MSSSEEVFNYDIPWFNVKLPLKQTTLQELATASISKEKLDQLFQEAQQIIDEEGQKYAGDKKGWYMQQFQERGTTSDRIAAAALKLSNTDFMLHMDSFALLFDVASKDSHHYESALKALAALWPKVLPARPLKRFAAQYFATLPEDEEKRKRVICYWFIEDSLKRTYAQFLAIAEGALKDNLVIRRECWLDTCGKLLNSVAELRGVMMALVVHKMGDPVSAISHKAYHLLLTMLTESSTNQGLLLTELEKLAFTRNCPPKTQRYCVNVMNQLVFNKGERKLAIKCVGSYLALFKHQVVNGCVEQGITNAIITGLRRAFPFAGSDVSSLDEHIDALFVLANTGPFLQRVSALAMVQQLTGKGWGQLETRFYRALYALLMSSPKSLPHSSQLTVFFTTLYKAVREDKNDARIAAFVHRLVQRCLYHSEAFICASLLLVGEVCKANSTARALLQKPKGNGEDQASAQALEKAAGLGSDDDDIEVFHDADKAPAYTKQPAKATKATKAAAADKKDEKATDKTAEKKYDPTGREPQYVRAQDEALWTLSCLSRHSHPAVVRLALLLAMGEETSYDMHPLDDLTFANFLDTFTDTAKEDRMSSAAAKNNKGVPVFRRAVHLSDMPRVSDPTFTRAAPRQIDVGHLFMHRYAVQRERFQTRKGDAAVWVSSTDDVDGDDAIDQATKISTNDALFGPSKADGSTAAKKAQMEEKKKKAAVAKKMADIDAEIEADAVAAIAAKKGKKSKAEAKRAREEEPEEDDGFSDNGEDLLDLEEDDEAGAADLDDEDVDDDAGDWGDAEGGDEYGDGMEDGMGGDDWQPDADAFDAMVTESAKAPSRKKQRQDEWERSREAPMRGRGGDRDFGGRGGGRGMGGRGGDRGRDFGGRGGGYSRGGDRGGRGGGGRDFGGRGGGYSRGGDRGGRGGRGGAPRGGRGRY